MIRGPKGSKVTLTINREGFQQPKDFVITREIIPIRSVKARILDDGIGYVRVTHFQDKTDHDLRGLPQEDEAAPGALQGVGPGPA